MGNQVMPMSNTLEDVFGNAHFISVKELAKWLRVSPRTVSRYIKQGELHAVKLGNSRKHYRISKKDAEEFVNKRSS